MSSASSVNLGSTLGALLVGLVLASIFFGITVVQTGFYYKTYPMDTLFLKSLVATLCALDGLSLALWTHATYWYLVLNFGNIEATNDVVWSGAGELPITGSIALVVHLFLARRVQILDGKWRTFAIGLVVVSIISALSPIAATVVNFKINLLGAPKGSIPSRAKVAKWFVLVGDTTSVMVDISIAGSIAYLLHRGRGFSRTNRILNLLTLYIVGAGVITVILRIVELSLAFAYPAALYFLIPYMCTSKAYTNALLATLNSRASRRDGLSSGVATTIEYRPRSTRVLEGIGMMPNDADRLHTEHHASDSFADV